MIEVEGVVYDYPSRRALKGVSFRLEAGVVLALVGPNGAGKTTLMRCMAALDDPAEGRIRIAGLDTQDDPRAVHAVLGYLPDFFGLYDELSVRRSLIYAARSRGVSPDRVDAAVTKAAGRVQLEDRLEQRAGELSRGLRQRLAIAQTLVHEPRVLLLDEPAAGLDPEARRSLSGLITSLAADGMTIVVSSHILAELEDYSTEMLMIRDGAIAGDGVVAAGAGVEGAQVRIVLARAHPQFRSALEGLGLQVEQADETQAVVLVPGGPDAEASALTSLIASGVPIRAFGPERRTLEQTYLLEAARASAPPSAALTAGAGA